MASRNSDNRLGINSMPNPATPVRLPAGRLRLATSLFFTGSLAKALTMGIVVVAALRAKAELSPPGAATTATRRPTSSAASAGRRSLCPSAQRNSSATLRPST
jgi:hypothetical protein